MIVLQSVFMIVLHERAEQNTEKGKIEERRMTSSSTIDPIHLYFLHCREIRHKRSATQLGG